MGKAAKKEWEESKGYFVVGPGVWGMKIVFANVYFVLNETSHQWVLVDAGLPGSSRKILEAAEELFGLDARPVCIILTHGHFDHRGAVQDLLREWDVPVYAHKLEHPYLNGVSSYPPPDPTVGGGVMSWMSWIYPKKAIDISEHLKPLPEDGSVPGLEEWRWIHTPGHSPGHISLFRDSDGVLIAGDAFVTTSCESAFSAFSQPEELTGPPKYFTTDWNQAKGSVELLASLNPEIVASGHGKPMYGMKMRNELQELSDTFDTVAVPDTGRYVREPARADESGTTYVPPQQVLPVLRMFGVLALTFAAGYGMYRLIKRAVTA